MLVGVSTGPAWGWLEVVLMTGATAAEDGVVMVIGVVECVPATVVGACISAWHAGVTGVWGVTVEFVVSSRVLSPVCPCTSPGHCHYRGRGPFLVSRSVS